MFSDEQEDSQRAKVGKSVPGSRAQGTAEPPAPPPQKGPHELPLGQAWRSVKDPRGPLGSGGEDQVGSWAVVGQGLKPQAIGSWAPH